MNDFDNEEKNNQQSRPDYYQPNSGSTYYTPPQNEPPKENSYQYSGYQQSPNNNTNTNYSSSNSSNYYSDPTPPEDKKPKKSKAGKIIVIILIVCLVVAAVGIIASCFGSYTSITDNSTTQSQQADDDDENAVKTHDSNSVATDDGNGNLTVAGIAENCMDSCVGITVYSQQTSSYDYFYGYGQSDNSSSEPTESGEGSGVIMSESNGKTYIITAAHVVSSATSYKVTLNDETEYDATLVAYDSQTDIGVLSIDATGLQVAEFADSDNLVVGEQVVAIGCPGGLEFMNSVTSGYISALDRPISSSIGYKNKCIQTDTAINPGNSGGALFNMQGQVVGIVSSKIASTNYEGMGFAVPSSTAITTANSLIKSGYVEGRAKLGIQYAPITSFNNSSAIISALAEKGYKDAEGTMVINSVNSDSDLSSKDVKQYDMIVAINGTTMTSTDVLTSILADSKPGDTVKLTIARIENNEIEISEVDCTLVESKS